MRDPSGKLWDCVLIQRKNKVGRGSAGSVLRAAPAVNSGADRPWA